MTVLGLDTSNYTTSIAFLSDDGGENCSSLLPVKPGELGLIVNRAPMGQLDDGVRQEIEKHGLKLLGVLPQDEAVYRCDCAGEPSAKLPDSNPVKTALRGILEHLAL